jgi:hypothetical protein
VSIAGTKIFIHVLAFVREVICMLSVGIDGMKIRSLKGGFE